MNLKILLSVVTGTNVFICNLREIGYIAEHIGIEIYVIFKVSKVY